jgi:hypothetical protein
VIHTLELTDDDRAVVDDDGGRRRDQRPVDVEGAGL